MSDTNKTELVVAAGYVNVKTQVGAGLAYVDVPQGEPLPDDVSDEDRERLLRSGAVRERESDQPYVPTARPVPGVVEPDEIDTDVIPGGSTEEILAWIGDDLARARVARHEELAKGNDARAGLVEQIEQKMAQLETEPPEVPEYLDPDTVSPAPTGGTAVPADDPGEGSGKPAAEVPASPTTVAKATKATKAAKAGGRPAPLARGGRRGGPPPPPRRRGREVAVADRLATPEDLASLLQQDLDASTAGLVLEAATAVVQEAAGRQRILQVVDGTATLIGTTEAWLDLPQRPVTAVASVTFDGTAISLGTATGTYRWRGARLWRDTGWSTYATEPSEVAVVYTHGYPAGSQELQLARAATLSLAKAAYVNPGGAAREQIDDYAVAYEAAAAQMEASPYLRAALRRQYGRAAGLVRIG